MIYFVVFIFVIIVDFSFFFFKQKTAYEMRISDWSSDVCSSDLAGADEQLVIVDHIGAADRGDDPLREAFGVTRRGNIVEHDGEFVAAEAAAQIGRASCRERVCQYV